MIDFLMVTFFALTLLGAILAVTCVNLRLVSYLYTQFLHKEKNTDTEIVRWSRK